MVKKQMLLPLVLSAVLISGCAGEAEPEDTRQPAGPPAPSPAQTEPAQPQQPNPDAANRPVGISAGLDVAERFTEAYTKQNWDDETPNSWYYAVEDLMTAEGYEEMTAGFDPKDGGYEEAQWARGEVRQWADVTSRDWIPGYDHSPESMSVYIVYYLMVEEDGFEHKVQDFLFLDLLRQDGQWKVDAINNSDEVRSAVGGVDG